MTKQNLDRLYKILRDARIWHSTDEYRFSKSETERETWRVQDNELYEAQKLVGEELKGKKLIRVDFDLNLCFNKLHESKNQKTMDIQS